MNITQEGTVYQLAFLPRMFPVNCYLVEEEEGLTLIDAALPFSWKGILKAASVIGKPITRILLTHGHSDHVGALDAMKASLPEAPVYVSRRDAKLLQHNLELEEGEPNLKIRGGVPRMLKTRADRFLEDGHRVGSLIALATPGHTPGHFSFLDTRNDYLIAGDAFQTRGGIAVAGMMRTTFPFPALATWDKKQALASARKLRDIRPTLLATGHGTMVRNPLAMMDQAIAEAEGKMHS